MEGFRRAIAVDPTRKGFGWVVLEGSERLVDWGRAEVRGGDLREVVDRVVERAEFYEVTLGVVEDISDTHRGERACAVIQSIHREMLGRGIGVDVITRGQVREMFKESGTSTWEIAQAVGRWFPELGPWVPPQRAPWMDENPAMTLFDAASFGLAALRLRECELESGEEIWL